MQIVTFAFWLNFKMLIFGRVIYVMGKWYSKKNIDFFLSYWWNFIIEILFSKFDFLIHYKLKIFSDSTLSFKYFIIFNVILPNYNFFSKIENFVRVLFLIFSLWPHLLINISWYLIINRKVNQQFLIKIKW